MKLSSLMIFIMFCFGIAPVWAGVASWHGKTISFLSEDYENAEQSTFYFVGLNYKNKNDVFNIDIESAYATNNSLLSYVNLKELYVSLDLDYKIQVSFGRRILGWSDLDKEWHLGFYQPQFRWNPLDPVTQGVVGLVIQQQFENFNWSIVASPFFIPDQGASYELSQGEFKSTNPWFASPPHSVEFNGDLIPIDYNVDVPAFDKVVFRGSYGAQLGYEEDNYFTKISYIDKPSNQVALGFKATLVGNRVKAHVLPKIYREQNLSLDFGYRSSHFTLAYSSLFNQPRKVDYDSSYNSPILKSSFASGPSFSLSNKNWSFNASALFVQGEDIEDVGPEADSMTYSLTSKYMFRSAYNLGLSYKNIFMRKLLWKTELNWAESSQSPLKQLRFTNYFDLKGPWSVKCDLLLVETGDQLSQLSHLRSLDQISAGITYDL